MENMVAAKPENTTTVERLTNPDVVGFIKHESTDWLRSVGSELMLPEAYIQGRIDELNASQEPDEIEMQFALAKKLYHSALRMRVQQRQPDTKRRQLKMVDAYWKWRFEREAEDVNAKNTTTEIVVGELGAKPVSLYDQMTATKPEPTSSENDIEYIDY